jgi:lipoate-protein ligase A
VEEHRGPAGDLLGAAEIRERAARILHVTRPALVLGSTQRQEEVDQTATVRAGVDVVRRRSGGGAVLVVPGETLWLDISIPASDPLWEPDVGRAFHWLGRAWADSLGRLGVAARWYDGPMRHTHWSRLVCFAGLGPGEVTVEGRKVVGISQRRTRGAALFQCCALLRWNPAALLPLFVLDEDSRQRAAAALHGAGLGVGPDREAELRRAIVAELAAR